MLIPRKTDAEEQLQAKLVTRRTGTRFIKTSRCSTCHRGMLKRPKNQGTRVNNGCQAGKYGLWEESVLWRIGDLSGPCYQSALSTPVQAWDRSCMETAHVSSHHPAPLPLPARVPLPLSLIGTAKRVDIVDIRSSRPSTGGATSLPWNPAKLDRISLIQGYVLISQASQSRRLVDKLLCPLSSQGSGL